MSKSPLQRAKEIFDIPTMAQKLGWDWKPGKSCRVPWRADRSNSGSVFAGGMLFKDFADGKVYDAPGLLAKVCDLNASDAAREFMRLAGVDARAPLPPIKTRMRPQVHADDATREKPRLPLLVPPKKHELQAIAQARGLSIEGLHLALNRGLLFACDHHDTRCWALCDQSRWLAQLRRIDGAKFTRADGGQFKAWTAKGSRANWPLGIIEASALPRIIVCEGGPDCLAVHHFAVALNAPDVAAVAMLGASCGIATDALPYFAGRRVRIVPQCDAPREDGTAPGIEGASHWQDSIIQAGASRVDVFDLSGLTLPDGTPAKDLNDAATLPRATWEREGLTTLFDF